MAARPTDRESPRNTQSVAVENRDVFTDNIDPTLAAEIYHTQGPPISIILRSHSGRSFRAVSFFA